MPTGSGAENGSETGGVAQVEATFGPEFVTVEFFAGTGSCVTILGFAEALVGVFEEDETEGGVFGDFEAETGAQGVGIFQRRDSTSLNSVIIDLADSAGP